VVIACESKALLLAKLARHLQRVCRLIDGQNSPASLPYTFVPST
jgi:hypothetical protein